MTYDARESSAYEGNPVELYEFTNGSVSGYYTSADEPILYQGNTYIPEQIQRSEPSESQELNKLAFKITVPRTNPVAQIFHFFPPTAVTTVKVYRLHRDDGNAIVLWMGRLLNAEDVGALVDLHCEPITTAIRRMGLRRYYQRQCPHVLYGTKCKASKSAHMANATVTAVNGLTVHVAETGFQDQFAGGMMAWNSSFGKQWRFVSGNGTNFFNVNFPFMPDDDPYGRGLPIGTVVELYLGCQHTLTDCINKFNNLANYGGFPYIPLNNPFSMTTLY